LCCCFVVNVAVVVVYIYVAYSDVGGDAANVTTVDADVTIGYLF